VHGANCSKPPTGASRRNARDNQADEPEFDTPRPIILRPRLPRANEDATATLGWATGRRIANRQLFIAYLVNRFTGLRLNGEWRRRPGHRSGTSWCR
jgi:hypothetical protein